MRVRLWFLPLCVLALVATACDDAEDGASDTATDTASDLVDTDTDVTPEPTGEVVSGLERSRALSALSEAESTTLCTTLATAANSVLDAFSTVELCDYSAVANSLPLIAEQGLEGARSSCEVGHVNCQEGRRALSCEADFAPDLARWSGCGLTVADVELCRSAANALRLSANEATRDAGITCATFDETTVVEQTSAQVDAACAALDACQ